ncbi:hypothetical protein JHS3_30520 [Jeongeupia sp. HS-3]|nr:hypothetical protein JHS3_30520 [Jeongeupia sp. HS-3]
MIGSHKRLTGLDLVEKDRAQIAELADKLAKLQQQLAKPK